MPKLQIPGDIPDYIKLSCGDSLDPVQETFERRLHEQKPIGNDFLQYFTRGIRPIFGKETVLDMRFVFPGGNIWRAVTFPHHEGGRYLLLLPRYENGKATGHVALYFKPESGMPVPDDVAEMPKLIAVLFRWERRQFYARHR